MQSILDSKWTLFIKVAKLGSLTQAATALDVPQSVISRHISQLEMQCGVRLFNRTGRGVTLTEFGRQLLPRVEALANEADDLADVIRTSGGVPVGEVMVGLLREGDVSTTEESMLAQHNLMLVGRAGDPATAAPTIKLEELQGLPLVLPCRPHPLRVRLEKLSKAHNIHFDCAVEADSIRLQWEIVAAGGGYAILSGLFERMDDPRFSFSTIVKPELPRSVVLASTLRRPNTLATRAVQKLIEQEAPRLLKPSTSGPQG